MGKEAEAVEQIEGDPTGEAAVRTSEGESSPLGQPLKFEECCPDGGAATAGGGCTL